MVAVGYPMLDTFSLKTIEEPATEGIINIITKAFSIKIMSAWIL